MKLRENHSHDEDGHGHFEPHSIFGFIVTIGITLLSASGWIYYFMRQKSKNLEVLKKLRSAHKIMGIGLFSVGILAIASGTKHYFEMFDQSKESLAFLALFGLIAIFFAAELYKRIKT